MTSKISIFLSNSPYPPVIVAIFGVLCYTFAHRSRNFLANLPDRLCMYTIISSAQNPAIKHAAALLGNHRARKKSAQTVLEGVHLIDAYLTAGQMPATLIVSDAYLEHHEVQAILGRLTITPLVIADKLYKQIRTLGDGVAMMAIINVPSDTATRIDGDCLILNDVQDAGNIGTLLRSASSVGIRTVISTPNTASLWSPKCLRAGMGAQFSLTMHEHWSIDEILNTVKTPLYATSSHADKIIYDHDLSQPVAWVMGHEGQGVDERFLQLATPISLPQPGGQESLNVGVAGSVCFYEMLRQRLYQPK